MDIADGRGPVTRETILDRIEDQRKDGVDPDKQGNGNAGYGISNGNMGAGKSGSENLGSEKPSDAKVMGSQRPTHLTKRSDLLSLKFNHLNRLCRGLFTMQPFRTARRF